MEDIKKDEILKAINKLAADTDKRFNELESSINEFANKTERRFIGIETNIKEMKGEIGEMKGEIGEMKGEIGEMKGEIGNLKMDMLTKDYLDERLFDLRGDIISVIKGEDNKLKELAKILKEKGAISKADFEQVFSLAPFPQIFV